LEPLTLTEELRKKNIPAELTKLHEKLKVDVKNLTGKSDDEKKKHHFAMMEVLKKMTQSQFTEAQKDFSNRIVAIPTAPKAVSDFIPSQFQASWNKPRYMVEEVKRKKGDGSYLVAKMITGHTRMVSRDKIITTAVSLELSYWMGNLLGVVDGPTLKKHASFLLSYVRSTIWAAPNINASSVAGIATDDEGNPLYDATLFAQVQLLDTDRLDFVLSTCVPIPFEAARVIYNAPPMALMRSELQKSTPAVVYPWGDGDVITVSESVIPPDDSREYFLYSPNYNPVLMELLRESTKTDFEKTKNGMGLHFISGKEAGLGQKLDILLDSSGDNVLTLNRESLPIIYGVTKGLAQEHLKRARSDVTDPFLVDEFREFIERIEVPYADAPQNYVLESDMGDVALNPLQPIAPPTTAPVVISETDVAQNVVNSPPPSPEPNKKRQTAIVETPVVVDSPPPSPVPSPAPIKKAHRAAKHKESRSKRHKISSSQSEQN
jgi:hypothetical protein